MQVTSAVIGHVTPLTTGAVGHMNPATVVHVTPGVIGHMTPAPAGHGAAAVPACLNFPTPPVPAGPWAAETPDVATVTQQLSRSQVSEGRAGGGARTPGLRVLTVPRPQVEDPLPPVFSGTPKGSGAGYGVGFDLEEFLNQSFDMADARDR